MTETSQNGWPASPEPAAIGITPFDVDGVPIGDGLAAGPAAVVLLYVAEQFHRRIEPLVAGTCWGYKYRPVTGGTELSNHASGTAVDLNATAHPLGQSGTFTPAQAEEIHHILAEVDGVVRWGGDYMGRVDEMHFEINDTYAAVAGVAARLESRMATIVDLYQKYNTVTNWSALAGAVSGAWIKVTDGTGQAPVHADTYVAGCRTHDIRWGGYHFAEPGDPRAQARTFVAELRRLGWTSDAEHLLPVLDLENGGIPVNQRAAFARAFLEEVHADLGGVRVALYSSTSWLATLTPDNWPYDWDITWAAEYSINDGQRHPITHYTGRVDAHQYTSKGSIAGVSGWVDLTWTEHLELLLAQEDDMPLSQADLDAIVSAMKYRVLAADDWRFDGRNPMDMLVQSVNSVLAIQGEEATQSEALQALSDDETNVIAAIRAVQTSAIDVAALATALAPALAPLIKAGATQDQVEAAMRNVFASVGKSA